MKQINKIYSFVKDYWIWGIIILTILIILFIGLTWLFLGLLIILSLFKLASYLFLKVRPQALRNGLKNISLSIAVLTLALGSRLLILDIYHIPSSSMENTLFPMDIILVNKLAYGPKLPKSPFDIPWVNLLFHKNEKGSMEGMSWPYKRLSGYSEIVRGDVIVFSDLEKKFFVKRCVGVSGDTLALKNGEVYTNNKRYNSPKGVKNQYTLEIKDLQKFYKDMDSLGITTLMFPDDIKPNSLSSTFSLDELLKIQVLKSVERIEKKLDTFDEKRRFFAFTLKPLWTLDNMGPFIVPKKAMVINLNNETSDLYQKAIRIHEQVEFSENDGHYYIDGKKVSTYTFKNNYYFVLGDNRKDSVDSRFMGFVPEENVVGRVQCVLFSYYLDRFNWDRFFKNI